MEPPILIAHAGCEDTPPGSWENIAAALACGADCIEVDLRLGPGGPCLSHDPLAAGREYLPFARLLARLQDAPVRLNCDLKERAVFEPALALLRRFGMEERAVFTGAYVPNVCPGGSYRHFLNLEQTGVRLCGGRMDEAAVDALIAHHARYRDETFAAYNLDYRTLPPGAVARLHRAGLRLCCWTVDEDAAVEALLSQGVYALTTNKLSYARRARASVQRADAQPRLSF